MRQFNFLSRLLEVQPDGSPFISIYLNTEPNRNGKKDFDVFLKKQFSDHLAVMEEGSERRSNFEQTSEKIKDLVESIDPSVRGLAVYARSGGDNFIDSFEFEIPFTDNRFYSFDRPYVLPLARLMDQNPTFAVVAADTNSAHIYVVKRAETIRREDIQNTKTNRSEVGGWSQMRYQRHIENFHQQHAKEVIAELEKIVRNERIDRVVLSGDQTVIIPLLRDELSKELSEKIVDSLSLNVNTPEHELVEQAREVVERFELDRDKEKIDQLLEVNYEDGVGVTGVEKTLAALLNGQVQELYLSADTEDIAYSIENVKVILKDYVADDEEFASAVREKELLVDQLIKLAAASAERIRFIEDRRLLKSLGGVGAILRYQAKGASNL